MTAVVQDGRMRGLWQRCARNRSALLGLVILSIVILIAITAPLLFSESPFKVVDKPFLPPFGKYLLGTDSLGRNVAAEIAHGAQTSLLIGLEIGRASCRERVCPSV